MNKDSVIKNLCDLSHYGEIAEIVCEITKDGKIYDENASILVMLNKTPSNEDQIINCNHFELYGSIYEFDENIGNLYCGGFEIKEFKEVKLFESDL